MLLTIKMKLPLETIQVIISTEKALKYELDKSYNYTI